MTRPTPNLENRPWVRNRYVKKLFAAFRHAGAEVRIVGGAVRNAILSRPVQEIDMAINIPPEEVSQIAETAGFKTVPTGIEHGTLTIILGKEPPRPVEVTSLRRDVRTDGRHADVAFTDKWEEDASRRDFTMNALYCNENGEIFDPLNGIDDVLAERVVFIGNPEERIKEDYLRILRFFRFSAEYGQGDLDPRGFKACHALRSGLAQLSRQRIGKEFARLLKGRNCLPILHAMAESGIYAHLIPGGFDSSVLEGVIQFEENFSLAPDPIRRLAALVLPAFKKNDLKPQGLQDQLALSSDERNHVARLWTLSEALPSQFKDEDMNRQFYIWGDEASLDMMVMAFALSHGSSKTDWSAFFSALLHYNRPVFPIGGDDLIARGFKAGPDLGAELKRLEQKWISSDFTLSHEELLK